MKHPAPSAKVSLVGDRQTVKLDLLDRILGLKALRSTRNSSLERSTAHGKKKEANLVYGSRGVGYPHANSICATHDEIEPKEHPQQGGKCITSPHARHVQTISVVPPMLRL